MTSLAARLTAVVAVSAGALLVGWAGPAAACACGAYVTNAETSVSAERAALKWDGTTEELVISMDVLGSSADAAWIMPVPAQAEVSLEDIALFEELAERTQPREEKVTSWWPNLGFLERLGLTSDTGTDAGGLGVEVLEQRALGEYTVAQLAASDPAALTTWLGQNGYQPNDALTTNGAPYAEAGWVFVAVKLTAPDPNAPLTGTLQPIKLRFPSTEPVYPMRLSQAASGSQEIRLYVLAAHRMDPAFSAVPGVAPQLVHAGWLDPGEMGPVSRVGQWLTDRAFLMRFDQTIADPSAITGDYTFVQAAADEEFQGVFYTDRDLGWLTGGLIAVLALVLLAVVPTRIAYKRRVRREYASRAYETAT